MKGRIPSAKLKFKLYKLNLLVISTETFFSLQCTAVGEENRMYQIHSAKNYKVNWKSKKRKKYEKQLTTSQQCCKADPRLIYVQRGIISIILVGITKNYEFFTKKPALFPVDSNQFSFLKDLTKLRNF